MSTPTPPAVLPAITEEQHAIARAYIAENIDDLLYWCDLAELLEQPFVRPERDHPAAHEVNQLAKIEGIPLRHTLRLVDADMRSLNLAALRPGEGAAEIRSFLR